MPNKSIEPFYFQALERRLFLVIMNPGFFVGVSQPTYSA